MRRRIFLVIILILSIVAVRYSGVGDYITLETIKAHKETLERIIQERYVMAVFAYILLYLGSVALSVPIAAILTISGGYFFGTMLGALYANIGATLGAVIAFLIVRYLAGDVVQRRYSNQLASFNAAFKRYGTSFLLSIHFIAIVPFFLVNILAAFTKISLWTFIWTTSLGIIPGSLVFAYAGQQLTTIESVQDIFTPHILLAFILLAVLALLPTIVSKLRYRKML